MGLFVGISMLSFVEIIEIILESLYIIINNTLRKRKMRKQILSKSLKEIGDL